MEAVGAQKNLINQRYQKVRKIEQGSDGKITLCVDTGAALAPSDAENRNPNALAAQTVATTAEKATPPRYCVLKKFQPFPKKPGSTSQRSEIQFMQSLNHPNIVRLRDTFQDVKKYAEQTLVNTYVVMDFLIDLARVDYSQLGEVERRNVMRQIAQGVQYLHAQNIMHRDIKPHNIFLTRDGAVQLGDLGLARAYAPEQDLTLPVVTRQYRPIELIYGQRRYGKEIDIWSLGVTFAEIAFGGKRLFSSTSDLHHLENVFALCGTPNAQLQQEFAKLPNYIEFQPCVARSVADIAPQNTISADGAQLIDRMLSLDPAARPTIDEVLAHPYLQNVESPKLAEISQRLYETCLSKWQSTGFKSYLQQ